MDACLFFSALSSFLGDSLKILESCANMAGIPMRWLGLAMLVVTVQISFVAADELPVIGGERCAPFAGSFRREGV